MFLGLEFRWMGRAREPPGTAELLELRAEAAIDIQHRAGHERRAAGCADAARAAGTRATLPVSDWAIGFLRCLNSDGLWICASAWCINRNYRNTLFP
jgi:hypothetical protein